MAAKKRRAHQDGSIIALKHGGHRIRVWLAPKRYKEEQSKHWTLKQAQQRKRELERQRDQGLDLRAPQQTLGQFLDRWLRDVATPRIRPATVTNYRTHIGHLHTHLGSVPLSTLSVEQVDAALERMGRERSARHVNVTRAVLIAALHTAERWGLVPRNVATHTDRLPQADVPVVVLTPTQAARVCKAAEAVGIGGEVRMALYLGMRSGEVLGLRWQDVSWTTNTVSIRVALQRVDGKLVLVAPKTKAAKRTLPLPPTCATALRQRQAQQAAQRRWAGTRWHDHDLVFCTGIGTPWNHSAFHRRWMRALDDAGVPHMRFHDLRHSCASLLAAQGVPPRVAQRILGHSSIQTTLGVYTHVFDDDQPETALTALDAWLGEDTNDQRNVG